MRTRAFLDFSKIEARKLDLETIPLSVADTVRDALKPLDFTARQKGLELRVDIGPDAPAYVLGDPVRLRQILTNLAGNAVKFTERGHVAVTVRAGSTFHFTIFVGLAASPIVSPDIAAAIAPVTSPHSRMKILVAEDNVVNQKVAVGVLSTRGHEVTVVDTGRKAVEALEYNAFDLVLMDVQMPEMDGLEATAAIRARERETGGHVRIIAMTAHAMTGDREQCLDAGMDGYLSKPLDPRILWALIDDYSREGLQVTSV